MPLDNCYWHFFPPSAGRTAQTHLVLQGHHWAKGTLMGRACISLCQHTGGFDGNTEPTQHFPLPQKARLALTRENKLDCNYQASI